MQLCRFTVGNDLTPRVGLMDASAICELGTDGSVVSIDQLLSLSAAQLREALTTTELKNQPVHLRGEFALLAPIESQEVWGAGSPTSGASDARMRSRAGDRLRPGLRRATAPSSSSRRRRAASSGPGQAVAIRARHGAGACPSPSWRWS